MAAPVLVVAMGALLSPAATAAPQHTGVSPLGWPNGAHQVAQLTAGDGVPEDDYGWTIGASAYVFTLADGTWTQTAELTASDGQVGDMFGYEVAISGNGTTIVVGAYDADVTGVVYVFTDIDGTWTQTAELTASDGQTDDDLGSFVAVSANGRTILASADNRDEGTGAAYVFTLADGTWTQTAELTASDGASGDRFGYMVGLSASGTTALVTAPIHQYDTGAAYVFTDSDGTWTQTAELTAPDGAQGDKFGKSAALSRNGSTVVLGAPYAAGVGAAYVFTDTDGSWAESTELTPSDGASGDLFSSMVAVSAKGSTIVVGALGHDSTTGAAYVFAAKHHVAWTQRAELTASDGQAGDGFGGGAAVTANGAIAVIGAPWWESDTGAVYVFRR